MLIFCYKITLFRSFFIKNICKLFVNSSFFIFIYINIMLHVSATLQKKSTFSLQRYYFKTALPLRHAPCDTFLSATRSRSVPHTPSLPVGRDFVFKTKKTPEETICFFGCFCHSLLFSCKHVICYYRNIFCRGCSIYFEAKLILCSTCQCKAQIKFS